MTDQRNEQPGADTVSAEEVEGHMRPKWNTIEEEPPAESSDDDDDVEGHMRPKWN